ncbi:MAG: hypothetical protein HC810_03720 [Acaryochloridaceae cyanobacterium RL_2_7]|nr:hypothetical protein [Acaryochloridaceae cyanobacterium RL_2_7]
MTSPNSLSLTSPTDYLWHSTAAQQERFWTEGQHLQSRMGRWRAYLNRLGEAAVLSWGQMVLGDEAITPVPEFADQSHGAWFLGTLVAMGKSPSTGDAQ